MGRQTSFYFSYQSCNKAAIAPFFFEIDFPLKFKTGTILSPPITIISVASFSAYSIVMSLKEIFSITPSFFNSLRYFNSFFIVVPSITV